MFFDDWGDLLRAVVVGTCIYLSLLVLLRVSTKRTLAKLNAFDFVVTVALSSTLSSVLLPPDVALAEGMTAMVLLVALQFLVAWLAVRRRTTEGLVKSEPTLVHRDGFLHAAMRSMRVTDDEIRQDARAAGHSALDAVAAVVLETDGSLCVLTHLPADLGRTSGGRPEGRVG